MIFVGEIILLLRGDYWTKSEFESLWFLEKNVDSGKSRKKAEAVSRYSVIPRLVGLPPRCFVFQVVFSILRIPDHIHCHPERAGVYRTVD
jgi:hypothetical protein